MASPMQPTVPAMKPTTPQNPSVSNPDNLRPVYSNFFGTSATLTDFTIYFLEMAQIPGSKGSTAQEQTVKAIVTLHLAAISALQDLLGQMAQQIEVAKKQAQEAAAASAKK